VTREEYEMIDFASRWISYDGGDELILPEFGVHPAVFYSRLSVLLERPEFEGASRLRALCRRKLSSRAPAAGRKVL